jgi:hypothetical protein
MGNRVLSKSWLSAIIPYSMLVWTIICFIGTWFIIIKYDILFEGFIAMVMTFFFAATIWLIPLGGLILLSLYVSPEEELLPFVTFKDLIRKGIKKSSV